MPKNDARPLETPPSTQAKITEPRATVREGVFVFSVGASILAIGLAIVMRVLASTALYDFNFALFHEQLTPGQREEIFRTVAGVMNAAIIPLVLALLLSHVAGFLMLRDLRSTQSGGKLT